MRSLLAPAVILFLILIPISSRAAGVGFGFIVSSRVNLRKGPGKMYGFDVVVTSPGMPVEIVGKKEEWYLVELSDGKKGWVLSSAVSKKKRRGVTVRSQTNVCRMPVNRITACERIAVLGSNVSFVLLQCGKKWCRIGLNKRLTGWVKKEHIWGVGPAEEF